MFDLFAAPELYINGAWRTGDGTYEVRDPATGAVIAEVAKAGAAAAHAAVAAADSAFQAWRALPAGSRAAIVRKWGELMLARKVDLARLLTLEQGKPLAEAEGEVNYAAAFLLWFAEEARRVYGEVIPAPRADAKIIVTVEPVGVVAAITPWNLPLAMVTRKAGPALAAGCTMILKPSEETPLTAIALAQLAQEAGVPAGVFNVISGDAAAIGGVLTGSPLVRKLSFTGSTRTGKLLAAQSVATLKRVSLELGGNAPFIVFDDADLDAAVEGAIASKFRNTGQTCVCVNRFFVQAGVYAAFVEKLAAAVAKLKVGPGFEPGVTQGPLINEAALAKVARHVEDAVAKGGVVIAGGRTHALGGTFYEPTVIANAQDDMAIASEETFGPLAAVFQFETESEVIARANRTEFGLSGYFYSNDLGRVWRVADALEVGMVGINTGVISSEVVPFGGVKESGQGREGSRHGIMEYVELKYLMMAYPGA